MTVCESGQLPETFTIVGSAKTDPDHNEISCQSPLGAALLGKTTGTTIQVNAPKGNLNVKILKIK